MEKLLSFFPLIYSYSHCVIGIKRAHTHNAPECCKNFVSLLGEMHAI